MVDVLTVGALPSKNTHCRLGDPSNALSPILVTFAGMVTPAGDYYIRHAGTTGKSAKTEADDTIWDCYICQT